jgi:hypothetical protein
MTPPSQLSAIVTIHDQDLLLQYESENKFQTIGCPVTYMFVGKGPVDKVRAMDRVIIAREQADNIEDYKFLVDFTSWYACINNAVPLTEFVALIQYDVTVSESFSSTTLSQLQTDPDAVLGYSPVPMADRNFIRDNMGYAPLREAVKKVYGFDIKPILRSHMASATDKNWPATNNVAMRRDTLSDFVRWFTPLGLAMGNSRPSGHAFERAIKLFCILTGRHNLYDREVLQHFQMNSHETQDFKKDTGRLHQLLARNSREP